MFLSNVDCDTGQRGSVEPAVTSSERARQREIAAYLSAASFPPGVPIGPATKPCINTDATLNALVQLGPLRLGCDRSFLSLIDCNHQFIVSEMTRTHALAETRSSPHDAIYLGVCKLELCWGVCPTTMKVFLDETGELTRNDPDIIANRSRYIINDFRQLTEFRDAPYVTDYPHMVSYLEVPLLSPLGYLLGSYCIVDNKPRNFDDDETVGVMNDIASTIMAHLELMRTRQNGRRSETLIEGLSAFIGFDAHTEQSSQSEETRDLRTQPATLRSSSEKTSVLTSFASKQLIGETPSTTPQEEDDDPLERRLVLTKEAPQNVQVTLSSLPTSGPDAQKLSAGGFLSSANIKSTFFRAATTIRQAMNMDGLVFLDAVPSVYGDGSDQRSSDAPQCSTHANARERSCAVIVQSADGQHDETTSESSRSQFPEAVLQRFIRNFPQGHVFSADEFGAIEEGYGPGKPFSGGRKSERDRQWLEKDMAVLFRSWPGAKYVIFLPLWHFQRNCWYAAALGWVADPTRAIDVGDIRLISAFGNSLMAEVSRLEALAASRAKSDFVSSISHELRSPLHGILASSELLRDGITDPSLLTTLDMLDSCGTTLLDTLNNLLDHAIATNAGKSSSTLVTKLEMIDLSKLVEDVAVAVHLSHLSENFSQSSKHRKGIYSVETSQAGEPPVDHSPVVILNVGKNLVRKSPTDNGAWKRIVMNLFSNALKYTEYGLIEVCLEEVHRKNGAGEVCDFVCFSVNDTGRGMSSDFIKYQLFSPFSQENSHSPGMGLGLSIVQQLVDGLGGTVTVESSVGIGTRVEVLLPLKQTVDASVLGLQHITASTKELHYEHKERLKGRTVCFITPKAYATLFNVGVEITSEMRDRSVLLQRALEVNAGETLGMRVVLGLEDCPIPQADLYCIDCQVYSKTPRGLDDLAPILNRQLSPLLLLCSNPGRLSCAKGDAMRSDEHHFSHPIGPRRLAAMMFLMISPNQSSAEHPELHRVVTVTQDFDDTTSRLAASRSTLKETKIILRSSSDHAAVESHAMSTLITTATLTSEQETRYLLLVDDNPINIKLLASLMRKLKHTFVTACNGLEAVQLYKKSLEKQRRFDMILMDLCMPIMDGFQATREIRQMEHEMEITKSKIVALTGLSSDVNHYEALASGCDLFLTKPVKLDKVRRLLAGELGKDD